MKNTLLVATIAGFALAHPAQADFSASGEFEFRLSSQSPSITVTSHSVRASSFSFAHCLTDLNGCEPDVNFKSFSHSLSTSVTTEAGNNSCHASTSGYADSAFGLLGPRAVTWSGSFDASGFSNLPCENPVFSWGATASFELEFITTGNVEIDPPSCPASFDTPLTDDRETLANLICTASGPIASSVTHFGPDSVSSCSLSATLTPGSYSISGTTLWISDAFHDTNSDSRFNQDDVDYLASITPSTMTTYVERFDYNDSGTLDMSDIAVLQCFIDACLDARIIGDANCDNVVDCADLLIAGAHPFAGELFTGSVYNVGLDADLDGDNDAADKAVLRNVLLAVEPANFNLDTSLNHFDNSEFLSLYSAGDLTADLNGDGSLNFLDVSVFIAAYGSPNCL